MRLNSKQICSYTGGSILVEPIDASELACGITWDSRNVSKGNVFVALSGEHVDGHQFVADVLRAGARIVLVTERPNSETCLLAREMGAAIIEVSSTVAAIRDLAAAWRKSLHGHVIALTGSSGKTTTKNLIRDVLKSSFSVVATIGNQNNELGVPNTLLAADPETQVVVVEMGMRGTGQIAELCKFVQPDMGLITNVGESHVELLGNRENIARAKAELLQALPDGYGKAFLNRNDDFSEFQKNYTRLAERNIPLVWYDGSSKAKERVEQDKAVWQDESSAEGKTSLQSWGAWAEKVELDDQGRPCFILHIGEEALFCKVPLRGLHNVSNAVAAASVGASLGLDSKTIVSALEHAEPECGRQEVLHTRDGITIVNDTYNANPDSMRAALMMFSSMKVRGKKIAVLGDMGELGDFAQACHRGIGELIAELPLDYLVCIGDLSAGIVEGAKLHGYASGKIRHVNSIPEVLVELEAYLAPGDAVLVKASHFMGLERVVGGLAN